jgi:predicted nucleotide-binding protein
MQTTANPKKVFVVFGRNKDMKREVFAFLKMLSLSPIPWQEAAWATDIGSPYIGEIIETLLKEAQAVVVLLTGDDEARLRSEFFLDDDSEDEKVPYPQPRPNVLFETGMAYSNGWSASRTILVEIGKVRICHALGGRNRIKLSNKNEDRWEFIRSLEEAGCAVQRPNNNELLRQIGNFSST